MNRLNRRLEQLPNWQYVAFMTSLFILVLIIAGCILGLISGFGHFRGFASVYLAIAVAYIGASAWKRWKLASIFPATGVLA